MNWQNDLIQAMRKNGYNQDLRLFQGTVVSLNPILFKIDGVTEYEISAYCLESVLEGIYTGARVLLLQDMTTEMPTLYAIGKLA